MKNLLDNKYVHLGLGVALGVGLGYLLFAPKSSTPAAGASTSTATP